MKWSTKEVEILKKNYSKLGIQGCMKLLGRSRGSVYRKAQNMGLSYDNNEWVAEEDEFLENNYFTMTRKEIAEALGRTDDAVKSRIHKLGITGKQAAEWTPEEDSIMAQHYPHMTNEKLAEEYLPNRTRWAIQTRADVLGLQKTDAQWCKARQRVTYNRHLFDNGITSHDLATILGYIYADGNIHNQTLQFQCKIEDKSYLKSIRSIFSGGNLKSRKRKDMGMFGGEGEFAYMYYNSKRLTNKLKKLGVHPNKTFNIKFPPTNVLPIQFQCSFIRGFFEGDGSIWHTKGKQAGFSIVCVNKHFVESIQSTLMGCLGLNKTKIRATVYETSTVYELRYSGNRQVARIGKYLYAPYLNGESTFAMHRKLRIFERLWNTL